MAIRKNRGMIFGTTQTGNTMGQQTMRAVNPYRAMSNMPSQFGRSTSTVKPIFGGRGTGLRRR